MSGRDTSSAPPITPSAPDRVASGSRALVLWLALLVSFQLRPLGPPLVMPALLLIGLLMNLGVTCGWWKPPNAASRPGSPRSAAWALLVTGLLLGGFEELRFALPHHVAWQQGLLVVFVLVGLVAGGVTGSAGLNRFAFISFLAIGTIFQLAVLKHAPLPGDVGVASHESITALLHGSNPYAITLPNPYDAAQTRTFYLPVDLIGDRLNFGYAYLPVSLIISIPGFLLGNVAYPLIAALVALTVLLRQLAVDATGRILALVPLAMPFTPQILVNQWVEPIPMLMLGVCAWAWVQRRRRLGAIAMGLMFATKQYFFFALPLLVVTRRGLGTRATLSAMGIAAVICGAFASWNAPAFWHSVVWLQFHLPVREDSVSLPAALSRTFDMEPGSLWGPGAVLAGLVVSALVALRSVGATTAFFVGTGLSILATVLLSTHSFSNYYALIEVSLVVGAVVWPHDSPASSESSAVGAARAPLQESAVNVF